ncbi:amidase family protein [Macrococcus lamae]|uniref:amidase family protein n=1 Tax=Macrococcus lamae TaxID=198484 RepID=UPI00140A2ED1|nr:amidase family protein [Macrococcus lamae]
MNNKNIIIGTAVGIAALIATVGVTIARKKEPKTAKASYAMYNRERLVKAVKEQLEDVNLELVRSKADFIIDRSVEEIQEAIRENELNYEMLMAFYLDRILTFDQSENGINGISEINPEAMNLARKCDASPVVEKGILFGIPVTVKENINTDDMITSVGTHILREHIPTEDADVVKRLKEAGAIILGKTNLSELANYMGPKMPSGYSSKHGQTLNPYKPLKLSPLGSSSGAGTSTTVNIGALALGTETTGSIVAPAAYTSIVGFKPSIHRTEGEGVFPLATSLDVVGPMTKNVIDAVYGYNAIVADRLNRIDPDDVKAANLDGKRIGVVQDNHAMTQLAIESLRQAGAEVTEIEFDTDTIDNIIVINAEFNKDVQAYAKKHQLPFNTLEELIEYNKEDLSVRGKYGQGHVVAAAETEHNQAVVDEMIQNASAHYDDLIDKYQLDSIAYLDYAGTLVTAVAGYPEISIPLGLDEDGAPHGLTITAEMNEDEKVLQLGYAFEQHHQGRYRLTDDELKDHLQNA